MGSLRRWSKIGEAKFYVEDVGQSKENENLFFDVESIKFFEGDANAASLPEKKYLSKFSQKDTRYLWGEFVFKNKVNSDYYAEVFFNFGRCRSAESTNITLHVHSAKHSRPKLHIVSGREAKRPAHGKMKAIPWKWFFWITSWRQLHLGGAMRLKKAGSI